MGKTALVTGITGQTGSYLAELLISKGYFVVGMRRRSSNPNVGRITSILNSPNLKLVYGDVTDYSCWESIINQYRPEEIYNLAAMSHVWVSFQEPIHSVDSLVKGAINCLEAVRQSPIAKLCRIYYAGSSECFGNACDDDGFQRIGTPFEPRSPYAVGKVAAVNLHKLYREAYGMFCLSGLIANHESPRRGEEFVTRKITKYLGQLVRYNANMPIKLFNYSLLKSHSLNEFSKLKLGNIYSKRDWLHAKDAAKAMYLMLQYSEPREWVIGSGETRTVEEFLHVCCNKLNLPYDVYEIDETLKRPAEVDYLRLDGSEARNRLMWHPEYDFDSLVNEMLDAEAEVFPPVKYDSGLVLCSN